MGTRETIKFRWHLLGKLAGLLLLTLSAGPALFGTAAPGQAEGNPKAYLPMLTRPGALPTATPTVRPGAPTATPISQHPNATFFLPTPIANNTKLTRIAIDGAGGIHAAYAAHTAIGGTYPVYYAHCPATADCASPANWSVAPIAATSGAWSDIDWIQLELDPQGRPRMLLAVGGFQLGSSGSSFTSVVLYATCDSGCTSVAGWTLVPLLASDSYLDLIDRGAHRPFALDRQGRPRFIYYDNNSLADNHSGTYYAYCDESCGDWANWYEERLADFAMYYPYLTFSPSGQTRIAYWRTDVNTDYSRIAYAECAGDCADGGTMTSVDLYETGIGYDFSMRLDSTGRPRLAIFAGSSPPTSSPLTADKLHYAWCDSGCLAAGSWHVYTVPSLKENFGLEPDLALDGQGRPQLAYRIDSMATDPSTYALGYALCDANCHSTTTSASWRAFIRETAEQLDAAQPIPKKDGCSYSGWHFMEDVHPSIALDAAGNPRIGYDARHYQTCGSSVNMDIILARFTLFDRP